MSLLNCTVEQARALKQVAAAWLRGELRPNGAHSPRVQPAGRPPIRIILLEDLHTGSLAEAEVCRIKTTNEIQEVKLRGIVESGTFTLTFDGETTDPIEYDATAEDVRLALEALPNIDAGDVVVSRFNGFWLIEFTGQYAGEDVPLLTAALVDFTGLSETIVVARTVWEGTGQPETVREGLGVGTPTPLINGAAAFCQWHHGAHEGHGYFVWAAEPREYWEEEPYGA